MSFRITETPIDTDALKSKLEHPKSGACLVFEGWVRDHNDGKSVDRLEYSAYKALANKEGQRIIEEAKQKFDIELAFCEHRIGTLEIGDMAVWAGVSSGHRGSSFDACRYIIDEVKARVPIWKKEHYAEGTTDWINCASTP
ncbi:molybdenum cofactor biosynthesis protein MoaE [Puniceicoccaceae bacterium K14]|nr:molybdenum cofactor biosynthesis protein MoaE [Puniceicoccaceae bacterium K14]